MTKERKHTGRSPNLGAYIAQAEAAGKHVASVTVNVTLTFAVLPGKADAAASGNDLDDWMAKRGKKDARQA